MQVRERVSVSVVYMYSSLVQAPIITSFQPQEGPTVGGTVITITGANFRPSLTNNVDLVPVDAAGTPLGDPLPCLWLGNANMTYSLTSITCVSPAGQGARFVIRIVVSRVQTVSDLIWSYAPAEVSLVTPHDVSPQGGTLLTLFGRNFGTAIAACTVTIAGKPCIVVSLSEDTVQCTAPPGVAAAVTAHVVVSQVASLAPVAPSTNAAMVRYAQPVILLLSTNSSGTEGTSTLTVYGVDFFVNVTVWLVRGGGGVSSPIASPSQLPCPVVTSDNDSVSCLLPAGRGVGWAVFVVNNDSLSVPPTVHVSNASRTRINYRPPSVTAGTS